MRLAFWEGRGAVVPVGPAVGGCLCGAWHLALGLCLACGAGAVPVQILTNPGFEAPYSGVSVSNAYGMATGQVASGWSDGSVFSNVHTEVAYAPDGAVAVAGSSVRVELRHAAGYTNGANWGLVQPGLPLEGGRAYTFSAWVRATSNVNVSAYLRLNQSPFTVFASRVVAASSVWQQVVLPAHMPPSNLVGRVQLQCGAPATLWVDEAALVAEGTGTTDWHVSPSGSDTNAGAASAPFQSISRAAFAALPGDTVWLHAGIYRETLTPGLSGQPHAPIAYAAAADGDVVISGCDAVPGTWSFYSNGIYRADVGWTLGAARDQVFVDGEMQHEARHPNFGDGDLLHPTVSNMTVNLANSNVITGAVFSGRPDGFWVGGRLLAAISEAWAWQTAVISASASNSITVDPATATTWWFDGAGSGFVCGLLGLLDSDREWFLQTNSVGPHGLYLRLAGGADPSMHVVEMKRRPWCADVNGKNHIVMRGLKFWAGAVRLSGTSNRLENCDARFLSHHMKFNAGSSRDGGNPEGGGVVLAGVGNAVQRCTIHDTAGSGILCGGSGHTVTRNHIYNIDYAGTYAGPIVLSGAGHTIAFNTAHHTGRDVLTPSGTGHAILYNDLFAPGQLCKDLGVIYTFGQNAVGSNGPPTRIAYNWVHDNPQTSNTPLIYLDNYCRNFVVDHNVCWQSTDRNDAGIRINGPAVGHQIYHNTLYNCDDIGTHTYNSFPKNNPDPAFWTNANQYSFDGRNNLFLGTSPTNQLVDPAAEDFRLRPGAAAIDSAVPIGGFNDGYDGAAPDAGGYEFGGATWRPGVDGWGIEEPRVSAWGVGEVGVTVAWANGALDSGGTTPTTVRVFWGTSDGGTNAGAWGNSAAVGVLSGPVPQSFTVLLADLEPGTTYFYRFRGQNAGGEHWSTDLGTFAPSLTRRRAIGPSADVMIDPIQGAHVSGAQDGDAQNTNLADDVVISDGSLSVARSGNSTGGDFRAFMKFDLGGIPSGSTITGATLRVNLVSTQPYGSANLRRITARDWSPADVVYSLGGTNKSSHVLNFAANQGGSTPPALGWYDLNVLGVARGWFLGSNANYGFALRGTEGWGSTRRNFASSRDTLGRGPLLVIDYDAPANLDSDGDALPDEWELAHWGDIGWAEGGGDGDGDGMDEKTEYGLGSDPRVRESRPLIEVVNSVGGGLTLRFAVIRATGSGYWGLRRLYTLESSPDLNPGSWVAVPGYEDIEGNDDSVVCVLPSGEARRFYRLRVALRPN